MAILSKTWTEIYNQYAIPVLSLLRTSSSYNSPSFLYFFKEGLKADPSPWTVLASSNTSVADTNDNWNGPSDIILVGTFGVTDTWPGSWMVLKSSTVPAIYLLLDYSTTSTYRVNARWSEYPYDLSDSGIYRLPTATGPEISAEWAITEPGSGSYEYYITMLKADDGSFIYIGTPNASVGDINYLMLNFLREAAPQDPYPWIVWQKSSYTASNAFLDPNNYSSDDVYALAPDGTMLNCSFEYPVLCYGASSEGSLPIMSADDLTRGTRPFSWPIRVVSRTTGYRGFKGYLEDLWWGAVEGPAKENMRWQQPGFEGQNMVVMRRGCWWIPCPGEPFKW